MPREINFVQDRAKQAQIQDKQDKKVFFKVIVGLVVGVVLLGLAGGARLGFNWQLQQAKQTYATTQKNLELSEQEQTQYQSFIQKVAVLTEIYAERRDKQEALAFFRTLFDQGVSISGLSYDDKTKALTFSLTADSVFVLEMVLNRIDSPETRAQYPDINPDSIRRGADGKYTAQITVAL